MMKYSLLFAAIVYTVILSAGDSNAGEFKNFGVETKGINIEINTELELFHIMACLSNSSYLNNLDKSACVFFLSPKFVADDDAAFGNSDTTNLGERKMAAKDYIYYGATHEIGHAFLNPILDNLKTQIDRIPFKYATADPSGTVFLCESILRSLTAYFLLKNHYDEFARLVIQGEKQQGYIYNEIIVDFIKDYASNRNNYKMFSDYVPVFLDKLKLKVENN